MGWRNPPVTWSELEGRLSDQWATPLDQSHWPGADGGDSPAWSRKRDTYEARPLERRRGATPYAELHCHSNFSFLDGASHAEELAEEAVRLGLEALALTDHDGFYGVVRFAEAARAYGLPTVFGAELTLGMTRPQMGEVDPEGDSVSRSGRLSSHETIGRRHGESGASRDGACQPERDTNLHALEPPQ